MQTQVQIDIDWRAECGLINVYRLEITKSGIKILIGNPY